MTFVLGSLVQLKSGGPSMTVTSLSTGNPKTAICVWFDKEGSSNKKEFSIELLEDYREL